MSVFGHWGWPAGILLTCMVCMLPFASATGHEVQPLFFQNETPPYDALHLAALTLMIVYMVGAVLAILSKGDHVSESLVMMTMAFFAPSVVLRFGGPLIFATALAFAALLALMKPAREESQDQS